MTPGRSRVRTARALLQGIAIVYGIAFVSLAAQIDGLYGSRGILPAAPFVEMLVARFGDAAWHEQPTRMATMSPVSTLRIGTVPSLRAESPQSTMVWLCSRRNCAT